MNELELYEVLNDLLDTEEAYKTARQALSEVSASEYDTSSMKRLVEDLAVRYQRALRDFLAYDDKV